jgi:hypothetical protein
MRVPIFSGGERAWYGFGTGLKKKCLKNKEGEMVEAAGIEPAPADSPDPPETLEDKSPSEGSS